MTGIFLKDFKNIRGQLVYYFVVFAVLTAVSLVTRNIYFMGGVSFLGVSFPLSAFAIDEKDRWDSFALASGVTRAQLVAGRYILAWGSIAALLALAFALAAAGGLLGYASAAAILSFGGIGLIAAECVFPVLFKVGTEKARALYLVLIVAGVAASAAFSLLLELVEGAAAVLLFLPVAVGVAGAPLSLYISVKIYKNKDF